MSTQQRAAVVLTVLFSGAGALAAPPARSLAYADEVIQYDPLFGGLAPKKNMDPKKAVGKPGGAYQDVSLGLGGLLELALVDHVLTNSGDAAPDLQIHEIGPDVEGIYVALQPADAETAKLIGFRCQDTRKPFGDGFCEIGRTGGGITELDIDRYFPGFEKGTLHFNAVQLVDDETQGEVKGVTVGADIDGVVALYAAPAIQSIWGAVVPSQTRPQTPVTTVNPKDDKKQPVTTQQTTTTSTATGNAPTVTPVVTTTSPHVVNTPVHGAVGR